MPPLFACLPLTLQLMNLNYRAEPGTADLDNVLREIYVLYSDCALVRNAMNEAIKCINMMMHLFSQLIIYLTLNYNRRTHFMN